MVNMQAPVPQGCSLCWKESGQEVGGSLYRGTGREGSPKKDLLISRKLIMMIDSFLPGPLNDR